MDQTWRTFVDVLRHRATEQPDDLAFRFLLTGDVDGADECLTFAALDRRARAIAALLADRDLAGRPVILLYPPGLEFAGAFFGCLYAGAIAVPAYPPDPSRLERSIGRLRAIVGDAGAEVILTDAQIDGLRHLAGDWAAGMEQLEWIVTDTLDHELAMSWERPDLQPDHPAMLQYTSGSTGAPKGVVLGHDNLLANQALIQECFGHDPRELASREGAPGVGWLPLFHDMGLIGHVLHPVYLGVTSVLMSPLAFLQKPVRWLQAVSALKAHTSGGPSFAYDLCLRHVSEAERDRLDLSAWDVAYCGAEPIDADTAMRFAAYFAPAGFRSEAFQPAYGLAEATLIVTGGGVREPWVVRNLAARSLEEGRVEPSAPGLRRGATRAVVSCGRPRGDAGVTIVDPAAATPLAGGEIGEVWVSGPSVAHGYWRQPELTAETFGVRLADGTGPSFLRTGDLGFLHREELFVTGRLKELIIVRGRNHYPADIESSVESAHPALRRGCSAAFPLTVAGSEQLAVVAEIRSKDADLPDVIARIRQAVDLDHDLRPFSITLIPPRTIPKTSSGKPQRHACRAALLRGELEVLAGRSYDPGRRPHPSETERGAQALASEPARVRRWLVERLARGAEVPADGIDTHAPLSGLGLGSLELVEITGELSLALGSPLSATLFYDRPTVEDVVQHIGSLDRSSSEVPAVSIPTGPVDPAEPIAVVGMACRLPGGVTDPESYWDLLQGGVDAVVEVPADRWDIDAYHDPDWEAPGKMVSRKGGFIDGIERFDPFFFEMSSGEAATVDPQQRLLLETCWNALERAGQTRQRLDGSNTGVYVGMCGTEYGYKVMADHAAINAYSLLGTAHSAIVGRLSYWLGLRGPNFPVDTACSSSLVAVHLACQALRHGECEMAVAAGVNVLLTPAGTIYFTKLGALSPDGVCRPFDAGANGYVRGEGCGAVVLKPLSAAQRDGDPILAVVRGSAVNQDGRSNGFTAPSGLAQRDVLQRALTMAGMQPGDVDYVEAHGTGTPVGDPIEIQALGELMQGARPAQQPLRIGSVKSNIGHLEGAAGIASLVKAVLMLQHDRLVPSLHYADPNPRVRWDELPVEVVTEAADWGTAERPRVAGVNAFGFSGTNAHVLLQQWREEAPAESPPPAEPRPTYLLPLSARGRSALAAQADALRTFLADGPDTGLAELAWALGNQRSHLGHRVGLVANSVRDLREDLEAIGAGRAPSSAVSTRPGSRAGGITFLFTGQGSQHPGMGRALYGDHPGFREALDRAVEALEPHLPGPLAPVIFGGDEAREPDQIHHTTFTQPALFALEYALARVWIGAGVRPELLLGHSVGEVVAACVSGVLSLADAARLVSARAQLMGELPAGAMVAIGASEEDLAPCVADWPDEVAIAGINTPAQTVISGVEERVLAIAATFEDRGVATTRLRVSHAFHSPMMDAMLPRFAEVCVALGYSRPHIPIVSNVTGVIADDRIATPDYWVEHVRAPVRFADGVRTAFEHGASTFVELGPRPVLSGLGAASLGDEAAATWVSSLDARHEDGQVLLAGMAALFAQGHDLDWQTLNGPDPGVRLALPTYPFQRARHWVEDPPAGSGALADLAGDGGRYALSGTPVELPGAEVHRTLLVSLQHQSYLADHVVHGRIVVPGAFWLASVLAAAADQHRVEHATLRNVEFLRPLVLEGATRVHVVFAPGKGGNRFSIASRSGDRAAFVTHVTGELDVGPVEPPEGDPGTLEQARARCGAPMAVDALYAQMAAIGIELGPAWRWTRRMHRDVARHAALGYLVAPPGLGGREAPLHPAQLDNVLAAGLATVADEADGATTPRLPFVIDELCWQRPADGPVWCLGTHRGSEAGASTFDLQVWDDADRPLLQMRGFHAREAPRAAFLELAGVQSPVFELTWVPLPVEIEVPDAVEEDGLADVVHTFEGGGGAAGSMALARQALTAAQEIAADPRQRRILWVTEGVQAVIDGDMPDLAGSVVWGLGRAWRSEQLDREIRLVDLPLGMDAAQRAAALATAAALDPAEWQMAVRDGQVFVPRLVRVAAGATGASADLTDGTVLVTGGLGYLGLLAAGQLARQHGVEHLLLVGRSDPDEAALAAIEALRGAGVQVAVARADVTDRGQLARAMEALAGMPPLVGVVHAAGVLDDATVAEQDPDRLDRVLAPKIAGAWNLHELTAGHDLRLFALFSSISSVLGSPGQCAYAAANAFVDGLAHSRRRRGAVAHSLNWGPWAGGGMTAGLGVADRRRLERRGIRPFEPDEGAGLLSSALGYDLPQLLIAHIDLATLGKAVPTEAVPPPLAELVRGALEERAPTPIQGGTARLGEELRRLPPEDRHGWLGAQLQREAAGVLALDDPSEVPLDMPLRDLGLDSLAAAELRTKLVGALGIELPLMALFDHPTLDALAGYLVEAVAEQDVTAPTSEEPAAAVVDAGTGGPLSSGQQRLWFLDRLGPRRELYHIHTELDGRGRVSVPALRRTVAALIERHELLRTCFPRVDGQPVRVALEPFEPDLRLLDLADLTPVECEERLQQLRDAQMRSPFDMEREPLARFALVRLAEDHHRLLITQHHIISDGWSLGVLIRDLGAIYTALEAGREPALPPPGRRFADHVADEQRSLADGRYGGSLAVWTQRLTGLPELVLPLDRPQTGARTYAGSHVAFELSTQLSAALLALGREAGATPFMTVTALFATLMARLSGQDAFAVGTVHANRPTAADRDVLGFFVNTVALPCDLRDDPGFRDLAKRVTRSTVEALDHGAVPFGEVVRAVSPERRGEDTPLFKVCVVQETPIEGTETPEGLTIQPMMEALDGSVPGTAKFDLTLLFAAEGGRITGSLEYSEDRFERSSAERMVGYLQTLAGSAVEAPDRPISELAVLDTPRRRAMVDSWHGPTRGFPQLQCIHDLFADQVRRTPAAVAIRSEDTTLTFAQLQSRGNQLSNLLTGRGVGPDRPVGLFMDRSPEMIVGLLGILGAGGAYVPLDPLNPGPRLHAMLEDAAPDPVVTQPGLAARLPDGIVAPIVLDAELAALAGEDTHAPRTAVGPDHLAYVVFTSGSTGRPKGACITHRNLVNYMTWKVRAFPPRDGDRLLHKTPVGFDSAVGEIWYPLLTGAELVLARPDGDRDPRYLLRAIREHRITLFKAVPSLYRALMMVGGLADCPSLRLLLSGGEPLPSDLARLLHQATGARIVNLYGPAEATVSATFAEFEPGVGGDQVPIGRGVDNVRTYVLDRLGEPVPVGVVGELCLGGEGVGRGYLGHPSRTTARFESDPFRDEPGARLYRTGDRVRWRGDGQLEFVGRRDRQVQVRGMRVEMEEVEVALAGVPGVLACSVELQGDDPVDQRLLAFVEVEGVIDGPRIRRQLAGMLPPAMVPSRIVGLPSLPRLPSGKVDRAALPEPPAEVTDAGVDPPRTATERELVAVFAEVLDLDDVGAHQDFFDLGGHSLLAVRVMVEVQRRFPGRVALNDLFSHPTVHALARHIEAAAVEPGRGRSVANVRQRLRRDVRLPQDIAPSRAEPPSTKPPRRILLTGATGFVGAHLLRALLDARPGQVTCLVRATDTAEARARIEAALRAQDLWQDVSRERIDAVAGDLARRRFGLGRAAFDDLAASVDEVLHDGAWVHHAHAYETLRPANVGGTVEVIRLASTRHIKPVTFVSSLDVFPRRAAGEDDSFDEQTVPDAPLHSGYAQSKWVAEQVLRLAGGLGVPFTIFRPGLVMGHGETGRVEARHTWLVLLIDACIQLGCIPTGSLPSLRIVPVDHVARAIVHIAGQPASAGGTFHLTHPETLTADDLRRSLAEHGHVLDPVPYPRWRLLLDRAVTAEQRDDLIRLAAVLPPADEVWDDGTQRRFDDHQAQQALSGSGLSMPPAQQQLDVNLRYLFGSGGLPSPGGAGEKGRT